MGNLPSAVFAMATPLEKIPHQRNGEIVGGLTSFVLNGVISPHGSV
jgi:hypothetical protein